jgi:hypothetical protein
MIHSQRKQIQESLPRQTLLASLCVRYLTQARIGKAPCTPRQAFHTVTATEPVAEQTTRGRAYRESAHLVKNPPLQKSAKACPLLFSRVPSFQPPDSANTFPLSRTRGMGFAPETCPQTLATAFPFRRSAFWLPLMSGYW